MADAENLSPPKRSGTTDPGAKDLADSSESDDHFSDAQSAPQSPIPKTRVERVDDEPSHGEVPGTEAHKKREGDAAPDEIAVIPSDEDDAPSSAASTASASGQSIPKTVVEESSGTTGAHSEEFKEKRKADADADEVVRAEDDAEVGSNNNEIAASSTSSPSPPSSASPVKEQSIDDLQAQSSATLDMNATNNSDKEGEEQADDDFGDDNEGFGDDFDDFEEGDGDADFDDFEDGFQEAEAPSTVPAPTSPAPQPAAPPPVTLPFPVPDFENLDAEDILDSVDPQINALYPPEELIVTTLPPLPKDNPYFLSQRSASLWSQLVAPPPLAPPDWIRSRIRRLFLVSLGVPVDLDEILPASKQKKLVLPSLQRKGSGASMRTSSESRSVSRVRQTGANASSTSLDSQGNAKRPSSKSRKKGPAPEPELDLVAGQQLANTTDEALEGMTDDELKAHVKKLQAVEDAAKEMLEFWKKKTDEKIGDREAFEGVIENLVKHARKTRK